MANKNRALARERRHLRVRKQVFGNPERPRLNVFKSLTGIYAQIIDDMDGNTLPFDGDFHAVHEVHADFLSRRPGDGEAAHVVMIGQRPEIDAIGRRPPGHLLWRQKAVRYDRMAVKIEIGWSHGLALLNKR